MNKLLFTWWRWPWWQDGRLMALGIALGSAGVLAGAYYFQYVVHLLPCELCFWQRKPHFMLIPLGLAAFFCPRARPWLLGLMSVVALSNAGIALFHTGVEQHWWQGLPACASPAARATSVEEARRLIFENTAVPCDRAAWFFLGLSMASWNGVISLGQSVAAVLGGVLAWRKQNEA